VRHRIQTPAYATFADGSGDTMLQLHEIINLSEDGVAIQCHEPLDRDRPINLCLDLAGSGEHIYTSGQVIWTSDSGRAGLRFSELPPAPLFLLREWLFLNAMAGAKEAGVEEVGGEEAGHHPPATPGYTDTLTFVTAVQREVEALGPDLPGALRLIAARTQTLLRASGAALALAATDPEFMECRASAGPDAPHVGVRLQVGSGFSGECVKTGRLLRCDDSELDPRVDRESCRALGIRSILAAPVRVGEKSIGIIEAFSREPNSFSDADNRVLQRLAETVLAAVNRAARAENLPPVAGPPPVQRFAPGPGSVLFASPEKTQKEEDEKNSDEDSNGGISMFRSHLIILACAAATIALALGYRLAPWIQGEVSPWVHNKLHLRGRAQLQTVLASAPRPDAGPTIETATIEQLQQMAEKNDAAAENALGLRYFMGDEPNGIRQDEKQAFHWFSRAAEDGSLSAQSKLGFLYWGGRGVPKDVNRAYFWTVLARARGDQGNKDLAVILSSGMTRSQAAAIEQQADIWLQQHQAPIKPSAGH
jgi:hypothetical protein